MQSSWLSNGFCNAMEKFIRQNRAFLLKIGLQLVTNSASGQWDWILLSITPGSSDSVLSSKFAYKALDSSTMAVNIMEANARLPLRAASAHVDGDWRCPGEGWCKGNAAGAISCGGDAAGGGVIRDANRTWIFGFSMSLRSCSMLVATLGII
ncbi:hypothetical protein V6N12_007007 [Hibiscus sabdariffa]|uniref:Uncharacterized protein n=1 Tax=Hibiscus sabdariffa TaxID=183260 RepID=A0ABR2F0G8_9ROSI